MLLHSHYLHKALPTDKLSKELKLVLLIHDIKISFPEQSSEYCRVMTHPYSMQTLNNNSMSFTHLTDR